MCLQIWMLLTRNVKAMFNLNLFRDLVIVLKNYALEARLKSTFKKNASIACIRAHAWLDLCFFSKRICLVQLSQFQNDMKLYFLVEKMHALLERQSAATNATCFVGRAMQCLINDRMVNKNMVNRFWIKSERPDLG